MADSKELESELRELGRSWAAKLAVRLEEIGRAAAPLLGGAVSSSDLENLRFLLHRLAGSGSAFGYPQVTWTARSAEYAIKPILEAARPATAGEIAALGAHLEALRQACAQAASNEPVGPADQGKGP